jgi:predicted nucleic acid-binding protein
MTRLFFDANVLFTAAHNPKGKAALIIDLGQANRWRLITSAYAVEEARRNLSVKFPSALPELEKLLKAFALVVPKAEAPSPEGLVEKDQPIFQAAHSGKATHLLTDDIRDFGSWMNRPDATYGIIIQTVAEFLNSLHDQGI